MEVNRRNRIALTVSTTATLILTLIGVMQLTKVTHFHSPLPVFFPSMAILLPSVSLFLLVLPIASSRIFSERKLLYPAILLSMIIFTTFLIALQVPYLSSLSTCIHAAAWARLFTDNSVKLERIETSLHCCGFNSALDRVFPLPSMDSAADTCTVKFKYTESCAVKWERETTTASEWCVVVYGVILVGAIGALLHTMLVYKRQASGQQKSGQNVTHNSTASRLLPFASYNALSDERPVSERAGLLSASTPARPGSASLLNEETH
ncbi:uncharacterized protein V1518DRAFT_417726 [Limtongia smithiae]|uniref:uncharacterized protein n=1 Tax=Limtongia smithiae TaxID=1125753 RepID=UPI0034CEFD45